MPTRTNHLTFVGGAKIKGLPAATDAGDALVAEAGGKLPSAAMPSGYATTADITAAVAALVASSPSTLDTLNELAVALANDPSFATTMTTALAGKAPLINATSLI